MSTIAFNWVFKVFVAESGTFMASFKTYFTVSFAESDLASASARAVLFAADGFEAYFVYAAIRAILAFYAISCAFPRSVKTFYVSVCEFLSYPTFSAVKT